jgi:hypothetical protein
MRKIDDVEFDIQKTILKKKKVKNRKFYVEYDKLTYQVLGIAPYEVKLDNPRRANLELDENDLLHEIFYSKVPLHKLKIRYDADTDTKILYKHREQKRWEFDYVYGENDSKNFIHLHCDFVTKKINANFIYENFKQEYTKEKTTEYHLAMMPESMEVYCIDKQEPSRLYDKLTLNIRDLFYNQDQIFSCKWLPDDPSLLDNLSFLHYNHSFKISVDKDPYYVPVASSTKFKPTLVYKQIGNKLQIQSVMSETKNFNLDNEITFYMYSSNDPSQILDTVTLNTNTLDNFNLVELKLKSNKPVKVISNYYHLHIEDANVSTYYKF